MYFLKDEKKEREKEVLAFIERSDLRKSGASKGRDNDALSEAHADFPSESMP